MCYVGVDVVPTVGVLGDLRAFFVDFILILRLRFLTSLLLARFFPVIE